MEELRKQFRIKIELEHNCFKKKMLEQSVEVLFERAYQIDTMLNIYEILIEMSQKIELEVLRILLMFPNLLAFLSDRWLKEEDSHMEELQDTLNGTIWEIQKRYQKMQEEQEETEV